MKKFLIILLVIMVYTVASCTPAETSPTAVLDEATALSEPSDTPSPTQEPSSTQAPTNTPLPTATDTPMPTPTLTPQVISAESGRNLAFSGRLGGGAMVGVALAPDASYVIVMTTLMMRCYTVEAGEILWEVDTEKVFEELTVSDDGEQVITRTRGGTVQRWDASTGEKLADPLPVVWDTRDIALSGNGAYLAALDNFDETFLWDTTTGELLQTNNGLAYPFGALQVAASGDGLTFLNTGIDSKESYQIRLWDVKRGRFLTGLRGMVAQVYDQRFSPDFLYVAALGRRVSGGLHGMQNLYLWRVEDGALLDSVDLSLDVTAYNFLADGATVMAGTAGGKVLFAYFRYGERYTYGYLRDQVYAHDAPVIGLSSSGDGTKYASAASDGSVKVWDVETGEAIFTGQVDGLSLTTVIEEMTYEDLEVTPRYHYPGAALSPAGDMIARTSQDLQSIDLIDTQSGEVIKSLDIEIDGYYTAPVFAPDGQSAAAAFDGDRIIVWDVETGLDVLRLATQHINPISRLEYSPDGTQIASLGEGELFVWDLEAVKLKHSLTAFRTFTYSEDGSLLVTDAQELGAYLVDAQTGRKLGLIETDYVNALDISPDKLQIAAAGYRSPVRYEQENLIYFLDVENRKRFRTIELSGYPSEVTDVAYSPDGSTIASIDLYGDIYLWNVTTGTLLQHFDEQVVLPAEIIFSADGRSLLIVSSDNTIQFYVIQS